MTKFLNIKICFLFFVVFLIFLLDFQPLFATEKINDFKDKITINQNNSLILEEQITYDFGKNLRHGIYRDFKKDGLKVKVLKVFQDEKPAIYKISHHDNYLKIKIGKADKLITGVHLYKIVYQIKNAISFLKEHDELYFNVTGNEWDVPIEKASAQVILPQKIEAGKVNFTAYTGPYGARGGNYKVVSGDKTIVFETTAPLALKEGLTIVVGLPKGILKGPCFLEKFIKKYSIFLSFLTPFFAFIFLFRLWWKQGKDIPLKTVIAQYEPPENLQPALISYLIKQKVKEKDIAATIVDLAVKGFLKIKEIKKTFGRDYELIKLPKETTELKKYEVDLLNHLFWSGENIKLSAFKYFHRGIFKAAVSREIKQLNYFNLVSSKIGFYLRLIGSLILVVGTYCFVYFFTTKLLILYFNLLLVAILMVIFASIMPKRTPKGAEVYWQALGFRKYLKRAEKYRLEFQEKEKIFEKFLPYAMVLGVVRFWTKAFEGIYQTPPSWFEGYYVGAFSTTVFLSSFSNFENKLRTVFVSPRSRGTFKDTFKDTFGGSGFSGGFSGGGGGGGGGGSW